MYINRAGGFFCDEDQYHSVSGTLRAFFVGLLYAQRGDKIQNIDMFGPPRVQQKNALSVVLYLGDFLSVL